MALTQAHYRFGSNDGNETNHGWLAAQDTAISVGTGSQTIAFDTAFLLRFGAQNDANAVSNINFTLQYKINAGSWVSVTTGTAAVRPAASVLTNNGDTTQRLTGMSGTFQGATGQAESDADAGGNSMDIAANGNAEVVYAIQILSTGVTAGDTLTFQMLQEGSALAAYSVTPTIYVAKTLLPPVIASTVSMLAGVLAVGAVTLGLPLLSNSSTLYAPSRTKQMTVVVSEGATARATRTIDLPASLTTSELALTTEERDAISDWSTLRISVTAIYDQAEVSWAELETPAGTGGASPQTLLPPAISAGTTLSAPTVAPGAVTLTAPLLTNTSTLYAGALALNLTAPLLSNTSGLYGAALALNLTAPLLTNTSTLYGAALARNLTVPLLTNTSTLLAPTVLNALALPLISGTTLTAPTVMNALALPVIASTAVLLEGAIDQGGAPPQTLYPPIIAATTTLLAGAITTGAVTLGLPLQASTTTPYAPTVTTGAVTLTAPLLTNTSTLYAGALAKGAVTLHPPLLASSAALTAPTVLNALALPAITNTATLTAPTIPKVVVVLSEGATARATRDVCVTGSLATLRLRPDHG